MKKTKRVTMSTRPTAVRKSAPRPLHDVKAQEEGARLRKRREALKLHQNALALLIGVSPRKYGYMETGHTTLSPSQRAKLLNYLDKADAAVKQSGSLPPQPTQPLNLLPEEKFLEIQQGLLANGQFSDFWLFGLCSLPVLRDQTYQRTWMENILAGKNYNIICRCDEPEGLHIQEFRDAISTILRDVNTLKKDNANLGKITLYPISIGAPGMAKKALFGNLKGYFDGNFPAPAPVSILDIKSISGLKYRPLLPILFYGWHRSVVCYLDKGKTRSFAAMLLENISANPYGTDQPGWVFISPTACTDLIDLIREFEKLMK